MKKFWYCWVLIALVCALVYEYSLVFEDQMILEQSILKGRTFKGKTVEVSTPDGAIKAYLMEEHSLPLVALAFGFDKSGTAYASKEGVALLAESSIMDGAGRYSRKELRDIMKEKGIVLGVEAADDRLSFSLSYVKEFEKEAIDILKAVLYEPELNEDVLQTTRQQLTASRQSKQEQPHYHLERLVERQFYGAHPYGREAIPDENVLVAVSAADIREYLKQVMGKDNLKVGIAGDINVEEAQKFLSEVFGDLRDKANVNDLPVFEPDYSSADEKTAVSFSAQNFVLFIGQGINRLDADFYPLYIANYNLGGAGLNSRLNKAVREQNGLTYGIYSYFTNSDAVDLWQIYFSATPDNVQKAIEITQKEYQKFYEQGMSQKELDFVKQALLSSYYLRFSRLSNIADMLEQMQVQQLGIDFLEKRQEYVKAVTLEQVNQAIRRHMPERLDLKGKVRRFETVGKIK